MHISSSYAKILGGNYFAHGRFPEVGQKQKTEKKEEEEEREKDRQRDKQTEGEKCEREIEKKRSCRDRWKTFWNETEETMCILSYVMKKISLSINFKETNSRSHLD